MEIVPVESVDEYLERLDTRLGDLVKRSNALKAKADEMREEARGIRVILTGEGEHRVKRPERAKPGQRREQVENYLRRHGSARPSEIGQAIGLESPTVSEALRSLEAQRLIRRQRAGNVALVTWLGDRDETATHNAEGNGHTIEEREAEEAREAPAV